MRLFKTQPYRNAEGNITTNMFFVLDDIEREVLAELVVLLEEEIDRRKKAKSIRINKWDEMSLNFLRRCCMYGAFEEAEMMDLSAKQLFNFVDKTLAKTYGRGMTFERWLDVSIDDAKAEGWMDEDEARENMESKRRLKRLHDKRKAIQSAVLPHSELRHPELVKLK